jgi:hypothetical protein
LPDKPSFDLQDAHKFFSADCFNKTWSLIEKPARTSEEDEQMIQLTQASLYHWSQRPDCTSRHKSIGYWQASRVYALVGEPDAARKYGQLSLEFAENEPPFYRAYAYEALARAEMVAGNREAMSTHLNEAQKLTEQVTDTESQKFLTDDLATIR